MAKDRANSLSIRLSAAAELQGAWGSPQASADVCQRGLLLSPPLIGVSLDLL